MASKDAELNPRTTSYEFLGPPGALLVTLGVPIMTYALYFGCSESAGGCPPTLSVDTITNALQSCSWWAGLWDTEATLAYLAWYTFCVAAWAILPGDWVEGTQLRTGGKQKYKINGALRFGLWLFHHVQFVPSIFHILADTRSHDRCYYHVRNSTLDFRLR